MAYPGFQRGGCLSSGPIRKAGGGGGVLSVSARYEKRVGGGGGGGGVLSVSARYEKRKGGGAMCLWPNASAYPECAGGGC